jgi:hypothetical protein
MRKRLLTSAMLPLACLAGCGSSISTVPPSGQNTRVVLSLTSTSDGQYVQMGLSASALSLMTQKGTTVQLLNQPVPLEGAHVDGLIEPIGAVSVPQDTYTSAVLTYSFAGFAYPYLQGGISDFALDENQGMSQTTVRLDQPIVVTGDSMGLNLDWLMAQSATHPANAPGPFTLSPTFSLSSACIDNCSSSTVGRPEILYGRATSSGSNTAIQIVTPAGFSNNLNVTASTKYVGVNGASGIASGSFLLTYITPQPTGSFEATLIQAVDPTATNVVTGMLTSTDPRYDLGVFGSQEQGDSLTVHPIDGVVYFSFPGNTVAYSVAGRPEEAVGLPFSPRFDASSIVAGQTVSASTISDFSNRPTISTITLVPQTVDGVVQAIATSGQYQVYSVTLADTDALARLSTHSTVLAYCPAQTVSSLSSAPLAGTKARFTGLLYSDAGQLKLTCTAIDSGV